MPKKGRLRASFFCAARKKTYKIEKIPIFGKKQVLLDKIQNRLYCLRAGFVIKYS